MSLCLTVAPIVFPTNDAGIKFAAVESIQQRARHVDPHLDRKRRIVRGEPSQQGGDLRYGDVRGDAGCEAAHVWR